MNGEVTDWAVALGCFQAYLDYVCRYEINELMSPIAEGQEPDPQKLKDDIMKHIAADVAEYAPAVFDNLGKRLQEVANNGKANSQDGKVVPDS